MWANSNNNSNATADMPCCLWCWNAAFVGFAVFKNLLPVKDLLLAIWVIGQHNIVVCCYCCCCHCCSHEYISSAICGVMCICVCVRVCVTMPKLMRYFKYPHVEVYLCECGIHNENLKRKRAHTHTHTRILRYASKNMYILRCNCLHVFVFASVLNWWWQL